MTEPRKLTLKQQRFVAEYLIDGNGTRAAIAAGYSKATAKVIASENLSKPDIQVLLKQKTSQVLNNLEITAEKALEVAWNVATADARELVEYRIGCCRYCWGEGFGYQRTQVEFDRDEELLAKANEEAVTAGKEVKSFDPKGGIGYDKRKPPNAECPECFGEGIGRTVLNDTRHISPAAANLFAGIKQTKEGLEVKTNSKLDALEKVFKHLGMYGPSEGGDGALSIHIHL